MRLTDEQIRDELRALRETPREEFSARLDAWAAEGFPAGGDEAPSRRRRSLAATISSLPLRRLAPAAGLAVPLVALVVAVSVLSGDDSGEDPGGASPAIQAEDDAASEVGPAGAPLSGEGRSDSVAPAQPRQPLKPGKERVQERSASMTLSTEPDEVAEVADGVVEVTERYDGIVVSSQVSTTEQGGRGSFDLRIPTANLQAALAELSDLASVASRQEGTLDITAPFVTAEERFQDARAEVDSLLQRLAEADSDTEAASIRERLRAARAELASARSQLGALKQRADFSRLVLGVVGDGDADGWSLGDAWDDAVAVLEDLAGAGLVALAVAVPLGGLALLLWLGAGRLRQRRRERTLDE